MEALTANIVGLSGSPADLQQLLSQLKQGPPAGVQVAGFAQAAAQLDPAGQSLGVLFLLHWQASQRLQGQDQASFIDHAGQFLQVANAEQIKLAPEIFASVCRKYKEQVVAAQCPKKGILPLRAAIRLLRPTAEHVTPVHADFLQLCILSKVYNAGAEVLEADLYEVDPSRTGLTVTDFFLYCYYGGTVCAARKQYARALELLLQAITAPALVGNAIVVACYKKFVLVSLIHAGALPTLPKFTASKVRQVVESECRPYADLASAYATHNADKLRRVVEQHSPAYDADSNLGLAKQVAASLAKRNIQRLTQTYLTLPLADIAANVGLGSAAEAEMTLLGMIGSGEIHAQLCEGPGGSGTVRFLEDPERYDHAGVARRIDLHIKKCTALAAKLQAVNDAVTLDRSYLTKVTAKERTRYEVQGASEDLGAMYFQP